jgi:hypothetical protein
MYYKAHKTVELLKSRGFEVVSPFNNEDNAIFLLRGGWGVAVPKSETTWRERGESPLSCWYWNPSSESEEEEYFLFLEEEERKRELSGKNEDGTPYHPF